MKMSNIKRCYNVASTLFGNIQRCSNVIWQHFLHFRSKLSLNVVATLTEQLSWITFSQVSLNVVETLLQPYIVSWNISSPWISRVHHIQESSLCHSTVHNTVLHFEPYIPHILNTIPENHI